ncbi:ABC transporter ATP-binding protein [Spirilliplanes yamanashiensis]|uniref:Multidrug ABC transporter ATP-binding protein n=1 Tax=Spirilliplanes yamanashiensis TaxID=42233 RepID=A0A8J3YCU2_9ACTN|nr:ABC transporter ATP-binding protein [Spirilliplanes yamanashiensis]MDP9818940.1 ATP-binding cassette subfamily B protein [Spirilliplanes yamanashiensis]GIJ05395.1 multidrug ABC transporter ATP-binding protein [Spirilliplanes yamanashiensis]
MLIRLLRTYLRPYTRLLTAVVALQFVGTIASLYLPRLNADIIDRGVALGDTGYIMRTGGWMLAVSLVQIACSIGAVYYGAKAAMSFGRDLRAGIFHTVGGFSAREVGQFGAPSLITRTTNDVQQVQMLVVVTCTMLVMAPIMCVGGIVMALREDVGLSWLMLVAVPVMVLAIGLIIRRMVPEFRVMQTRIDTVNRVLREQLTGIRVVRAFVREPYETRRFGQANADLTDTALRVGKLQALIFPVVMFVFNASSVAVLWFGAFRVDAGVIEIGALTAFLQYLVQILMSVMMATFMAMMVPRAAVSAERITEVLDTASSVVSPAAPVADLPGRGTVELRHVEFAYPGAEAPVLRDVSFTAVAGRTTAVIGSTGAGKTTLLGLIPRLFDATGGSVLVNGVDVREVDLDALWDRIGIVPQRPYLFSGTVASNLRYGNPDATDDQLWRALEIAQAKDFVAAMPEGLDAPIAQGGTNVSGGQRQRLAIARALVHEPEIYLFDDSFSALDLGTDARLRAALRPVTADATVIIVAQRVSTIVDADQIVVLEDGAVVGVGRHAELLETCPTYVEIVESQQTVGAAA